MSVFSTTCAFVGILLILLPLVGWRSWKSGVRAGIESATMEVLASHEKLHEARQVAEHCRLQWQEWERKANGFQGINAGILAERDKWQHLYFDQSVAHGNAQAMMMSTIDYMAGKLRQAGIEVPIPKVLAEVQQEFISQHVTRLLPVSDPKLYPSPQIVGSVQSKEGTLG